jgi:formate hydrogenlyase subunit 3/multisubunit Na+/H+ antiporter MnhD subunit
VLGAASAVGGGAAAAASGIGVLRSGLPEVWSAAWTLPAGALVLRLDALASVFLLLIAVIGALCAVYGVEYLRHHAHGRPVGGSFAAYNVLLISMTVVVTANDVLLLIVAWELMTLSSWALVVSDHDAPAVRVAGLQYLIAAHLATVALLLLVMLLASASGTFEISGLSAPAAVPAGLLFVLALIGFGTKAGIVPMHVWLPDAHPAAPSHVSALMSAVMITMGFYGLARFLPLLGAPSAWWGYLLMTLGAAGAMGGIAFGLAQRDVKRTLAYSTVENAGIITLAMGVGILGSALRQPVLAGIAWTAALLHVWNHALAKALLFLGFGAIAQRGGSRSLDAMGGLLRRWRYVGAALVVGAVAISSLPGLNVFASEWLLLRALLAGATTLHGAPQIALLAGVVALALTGGIAVACFTRLIGLGLLGTPRSAVAAHAPEPGWNMRAPLVLLAATCLAIAAVPARVSAALAGAVHIAAPAADVSAVAALLEPLMVLLPLMIGATVVLLGLRFLVRRPALRRKGATWGCGYPEPTARMQYTSTSFGEPLTRVFQPLLRTASGVMASEWSSETPDRVLAGFYMPMIDAVRGAGQRLRALHSPRVTRSLLYVVATVLFLVALLFRPEVGTGLGVGR